MARVTIEASKFITDTVYFNHPKPDQLTLSPPTYDKSLVAEGYDNILKGSLKVKDQTLVFEQIDSDSHILLKELTATLDDKIILIFKDLEFKTHTDKKMLKALKSALSDKLKNSVT